MIKKTIKKRKINIIVDNDSWVIPYAKKILELVDDGHDQGFFYNKYEHIKEADIGFYLGCVNITPQHILKKCQKNLVVHASNLPHGRGFSPLTWQILEGKNEIPVSLFEMTVGLDEGPIVYREKIIFEGHELLSELQSALGNMIVLLCLRYINSSHTPESIPQEGKATYYKRRKPIDSKIDINSTIKDVFNILRVADNERYPVYFENNGFKYVLKIEKEKT